MLLGQLPYSNPMWRSPGELDFGAPAYRSQPIQYGGLLGGMGQTMFEPTWSGTLRRWATGNSPLAAYQQQQTMPGMAYGGSLYDMNAMQQAQPVQPIQQPVRSFDAGGLDSRYRPFSADW